MREGIFFFFFNDTATTEIYTLSLHDALPIFLDGEAIVALIEAPPGARLAARRFLRNAGRSEEHRLNSSHDQISYAVFCLKKKNKNRSVGILSTNNKECS